jgi:ketosteroid isomerase-like protein
VIAQRILAALALLAGCGGALPVARRFVPDDRRAVEAVLVRQQDAWNRGDLEGFMAGYAHTPELVFTSGGHVRRGWQETHDRYLARYGGAGTGASKMGQLAFEILAVQPLGADGAVVLGHWRLTDTPEAGGGVFSVVLERQADGWKIVHDHTSSEPAK